MKKSSVNTPARVAVFRSIEHADRVVHELHRAGFDAKSISLICPTCEPGRPTNHPDEYELKETAGAHAPAAIASGGAIGAVLGGAIALASVAATGGMALLVVGPLFAGAAGGAVAGGLIGAMTSRGFDTEIADYYDQAVKKGKVLVGVEYEGPDQEERLALAERIFHEAGAEPIALTEG